MPILSKRSKIIIFLLLLFSPTIWFVADYAFTYLSHPLEVKQYQWASDDGGWRVNLSIFYPAYIISGEAVPVNLALTVRLTSPYTGISVQQLGVEVRDASLVNSTTNTINQWRTLTSSYTTMNANYTTANQLTKKFEIAAAYPPSDSVFDPFVISRRVAVNGVVGVTIYSNTGNTTSTDSRTLSMLDAQTFYIPQLSTMRSSTSWIVYQLAAIALLSVAYLKTSRGTQNPADLAYALKLDSHRLRRSVAELEELRNSGEISESNYRGLKETYERELARLEKSL